MNDKIELENIVSEDDLLNDENFEVVEEETYEPVICQAWNNSEDFMKYIHTSIRNLTPTFEGSKNSLRRAFSHLKNIQAELIEGVEQDAEFAQLSEDDLRTLDGFEESIESCMEQIASTVENGLTKTATKSSKFTYMVQPFIFGLARIIINAKVSQGKNIEEMFEKMKERYGLADREKLELYFVLNDMGYPIRSSFVDGLDMADQFYS